jgi:hypothetical protein
MLSLLDRVKKLFKLDYGSSIEAENDFSKNNPDIGLLVPQ